MKAWMSIVLLAACGHSSGDPSAVKDKPPAEVKQAWSSKVQARLEKLAAAAKAAAGGELGAPGDVKLALDFDDDDATKHPNAIAVQLDDVQSATEGRPK